MTLAEGLWPEGFLLAKIQNGAHERAGKAASNFTLRIPPPDSDLVQQVHKDPSIFDFLVLDDDFHEHELELGLIAHLKKFLSELGQGFTFAGRQHHLNIQDRDFYLDPRFYHLRRYEGDEPTIVLHSGTPGASRDRVDPAV